MAKNDYVIQDIICPECGHNVLSKPKKEYTPRKRLTLLQLKRNKDLMRLIRSTVRSIKKNIPSENSVKNEYYFMKNIEKYSDIAVKIGIHRYLEGNHVYGGKGFSYLSKIIEYTQTNSERQYELEQKRLGTLPKKQTKEEVDG
tara:strand:+ start:332 stop:760 length:429 start_codon:yes stop_codon:yes gene_type:complete